MVVGRRLPGRNTLNQRFAPMYAETAHHPAIGGPWGWISVRMEPRTYFGHQNRLSHDEYPRLSVPCFKLSRARC